MIRIKINGWAGQGIKFLSDLLANLLKDIGYEVAVVNNYSPFIRYGKSDAKIIFSKEKIENPIAENFDFEYDLSNPELVKELSGEKKDDERINITLLRKIIRDLNLKIPEKEIERYLKNDD